MLNKKILVLLVAVFFAGSIFMTTGIAQEGPFVIGLSNFSLGNSWRVQMVEEARYAASEIYGDLVEELIVTEAEDDISKQISDIEDLIVRQVDAILITAASPQALIP